MKPFFSIIVPIYKVEKYLQQCVDSIINQTFSNFELILVDDGSPDECPRICDKYAKQDSRVKVVHKVNGGLVSARNIGIKSAVGNYICYVDGDDWIDTKLLETIYEKVLKNKKPDMIVFGAVRQYIDHQVPIPNDIEEGMYDKSKLEKEIYPYMMYDPRKPFCNGLIFPVAWNKIYKNNLLKNNYCTDERIRMGEDNAFVFECLFKAQSVFFCKDILYFYNQLNAESMTNNYDENRFKNNLYLNTYIESHLGGVNSIMDLQINAFKVYWLIMAVFHEVKCNRPLLQSRNHIKQEIKKTNILNNVSFKGIPLFGKMYLFMLKLHLYLLVLVLSKMVSKFRK